jgi:hypothetical protein
MLDLHPCLSVSVNVRDVLHTQPLRFIYNKILFWVSLYPYLSLSILYWIILLTFNTIWQLLHAILSPPLALLFLSHQPYSFDCKRWDSQCQWP